MTYSTIHRLRDGITTAVLLASDKVVISKEDAEWLDIYINTIHKTLDESIASVGRLRRQIESYKKEASSK